MPDATPTTQRPKHRSPLRDEAKVLDLLMKTRSVTLTARMLGVAAPRLSRWLHREKRREWWETTKAAWSAELTRERQRRYRKRRAARDGRKVTPRQRKKATNPATRCPLCGARGARSA